VTDGEFNEIKLIIEEWKVVIQTQMHFNEMIMKMRTTAISIFLAIFGAAAYSLQSNLLLQIFNYRFHASIIIAMVGIFMLLSVFVIDYFYYDKMLRGAVEKGYSIDDHFKNTKIFGIRLFGLNTSIKKGIGKMGRSKRFIKGFYAIPIVAGIIFMIVVYYGYIPSLNVLEVNSILNSTTNGTG